MKKFLAILLCAMIICAMPLVAFAEEGVPTDTVVQESEETTPAETLPEETEAEELSPEEMAQSTSDKIMESVQNYLDELSANEEAPEVVQTTTEKIVSYIQTHLEEISVIVTLILTVFYQARKHKLLNRSVATLNNNAVTVAENSNAAMQQSVAVVGGYKDEMVALLDEIRKGAEEKQKIEELLEEVHTHLTQSKLANVEFANELAELLVLANIPNSKKDELYARHQEAIKAISAVEENVTHSEVIKDDNGKEE